MINYIDCGLYDGLELDKFLEYGFEECRCYGFEAHPVCADQLKVKYLSNSNVDIFNVAITDDAKVERLYLTEGNGSSIFRSKNNVTDEYLEVAGIPLSHFLDSTINKDDFNILRFNIEGAEWHLINDLVSSGWYKYINLYLGAEVADDIRKVDELKDKEQQYLKLLNDNGITIYPFCNNLKNSIDLKSKINELIV